MRALGKLACILALLACGPDAADATPRRPQRGARANAWTGGGVAAVCGNGVIEGSEECDDSNAISLDGCSSSCVIELIAGEYRVVRSSTELGLCAGSGVACNYNSFCSIFTGDTALELIGICHVGNGHLSASSSQRLCRSTNLGLSWCQIGESTTINTQLTAATTSCTILSNVATCVVSSGHGFTTENFIYTSMLSINVAQGSPRQVSATTVTSISFTLAGADGPLADGVGIILDDVGYRGVRATRFSDNSVGIEWSSRGINSGDNTNRAYFQRTTDDDNAFGTAVQLGALGTSFTFAGGSPLELTDGRLLAPAYWQSSGTGTRYTLTARVAPTVAGASWSTLSTMAQDSDVNGRQYEPAHCDYLSSGELLCLIREDVTGSVYRIISLDDGTTWTAPVAVFGPSYQIPIWREFTNGEVVAIGDTGGAVGARDAALFHTHDPLNDTSWTGPVTYAPIGTEAGATDDIQEAGIVECATNRACILLSQEVGANTSARTVYQEVGVGIVPPSRPEHNTYNAYWPSSQGSFVDYGNAVYGNGDTGATWEFMILRESDLSSTQTIVSRAATGQFQSRIRLASSALNVGIASSVTVFASWTASAVMPIDLWEHVVIRFEGGAVGNAGRLRVWFNNVEDTTGTFSGTIPAALTSPNSTAVTQVGGYAVTASQNLLDVHLAYLRRWSVAIPVANIPTLYNGRVPLSLAAANTAVGGTATYSIRMNNSWVDERGFFATPTPTGSISFSQRKVP